MSNLALATNQHNNQLSAINYIDNKISEQERQRRQKAWDASVANFALERIYPSNEMRRIGQMYIDGEITLEEQGQLMRKAILDGLA